MVDIFTTNFTLLRILKKSSKILNSLYHIFKKQTATEEQTFLKIPIKYTFFKIF